MMQRSLTLAKHSREIASLSVLTPTYQSHYQSKTIDPKWPNNSKRNFSSICSVSHPKTPKSHNFITNFNHNHNSNYTHQQQQQRSTFSSNAVIAPDFSERVIAVTGAGKGIGRDIALTLSKHGATVIAITRTESDLTSLVAESTNGTIIPVLGDVSIDSDVQRIINECRTNKCDSIVNNAGISIVDNFIDAKIEDIRKVHSINFDAIFVLSQGIVKNWINDGIKGTIVNISSSASIKVLKEHTAYCTSKFALDGLSKVMALELGEYGIRVNSIHPTVTMTEMGKRVWGEHPEKAKPLLDQIPLGRFMKVPEVTQGVLFLLSDSSSAMTGQRLVIDGGLTML